MIPKRRFNMDLTFLIIVDDFHRWGKFSSIKNHEQPINKNIYGQLVSGNIQYMNFIWFSWMWRERNLEMESFNRDIDRIRYARCWWKRYREGIVNILQRENEFGCKNKQRWIPNCASLIENIFFVWFWISFSCWIYLFVVYIFEHSASCEWCMSIMHIQCSICYHFIQTHTSPNFNCQWIESQSSISVDFTSWSFAIHFSLIFWMEFVDVLNL